MRWKVPTLARPKVGQTSKPDILGLTWWVLKWLDGQNLESRLSNLWVEFRGSGHPATSEATITCNPQSDESRRLTHCWTRQHQDFPAHFELATCDKYARPWQLFCENHQFASNLSDYQVWPITRRAEFAALRRTLISHYTANTRTPSNSYVIMRSSAKSSFSAEPTFQILSTRLFITMVTAPSPHFHSSTFHFEFYK